MLTSTLGSFGEGFSFVYGIWFMKGWVYVISNKGMPNLVKVGYSTKDPELRARELNHTGSPHPYIVDYELLIEEPRQIEQNAHKHLLPHREGKEWFRCSAEVAIAAIKQAAGTQGISETYKRAERVKAEEIWQLKLAEQEKNRSEKKKQDDIEALLLSEETKIKGTYNQKFEQQFPPLLLRTYWGWSSACIFFALIFLFTNPEKFFTGIIFVSVCFGWLAGFFLLNHFEEKQKKSKPYLSLTNKREEELAAVRERKITCQSCATNIRFERKIELLANPDTIWNCPNCKTPISSPYSPKKNTSIDRNLSNSSKATRTLIESTTQQNSENNGCVTFIFFILGAVLFIWLSLMLSDNSDSVNSSVENSVAQPATEKPTSLSNQPNVTAPLPILSNPVKILQESAYIPKRESNPIIHRKNKRSASDLRNCLSLQTNEEIAKCVKN